MRDFKSVLLCLCFVLCLLSIANARSIINPKIYKILGGELSDPAVIKFLNQLNVTNEFQFIENQTATAIEGVSITFTVNAANNTLASIKFEFTDMFYFDKYAFDDLLIDWGLWMRYEDIETSKRIIINDEEDTRFYRYLYGETKDSDGEYFKLKYKKYEHAGMQLNSITVARDRISKNNSRENYVEYAEESFIGVGFSYERALSGNVSVYSVIPGGPADRAGLKIDDQIVSIDNKPTLDYRLVDIFMQLEGDEGISVIFEVLRNDELMEIEVRREPVRYFSKFECLEGNCEDGYAKYMADDGTIYEHNFVNKMIEGELIKIKPDGVKLNIQYENGQPAYEPATITWPDGAVYQGYILEEVPNGEGTLTSADGSVHTGLWDRGRYVEGCYSGDCENGNGIIYYPNGDIYEGEFANGVPHGYGVIQYKDNDLEDYSGTFENGFPSGKTSFWDVFLAAGDPVENIFQIDNFKLLFNKNGLTENDWNDLVRKYNFVYSNDTYFSPDKKFSVTTWKNGHVLDLNIYIYDESDLEIFGFNRNYTYSEMESLFGYEYWDSDRLAYTIIACFDSDMNRDHHFEIKFSYNSEVNADGTNHIYCVTYSPIKPDSFELTGPGKLGFIETGCVDGDCESGDGVYQWSDGNLYEGSFTFARPYYGTVYTYWNRMVFTKFYDGVPQNNLLPSNIEKMLQKMDEVLFDIETAMTENSEILETKKWIENNRYLERLYDDKEDEDALNSLKVWAQSGKEHTAKSIVYTRRAYDLIENRSNCPEACTKLARMLSALDVIEDVFDELLTVAGQGGAVYSNNVENLDQYYSAIKMLDYSPVIEELSSCGYFEE